MRCHVHDRMLDLYPRLNELGQRSYPNVAARVGTLATRSDQDPCPDDMPQWMRSMAAFAVWPDHLYASEARDTRPVVAELLDAIIQSIWVARHDDDAVQELAAIVGAPGASDLEFDELRRMGVRAGAHIGQIRHLRHRSWLLGITFKIASFAPTDGSSKFNSAARNWLWKHVYTIGAERLIRAVREARRAKLIAAWPEVERWMPPTSAAAWFKYVA